MNENNKNKKNDILNNSEISSSTSGSISSTDSDIFSLSEDSFFTNLSEIDELKNIQHSSSENLDSNKILEMLNVSESVLTTHDLSKLFSLILKKAISLTEAESGYLLLKKTENKDVDTEKQERIFDADDLEVAHSENNKIGNYDKAYKQISKTVINKVIGTKKVEIIKNALNDENFESQQSIINLKLKSIMCAPMIIRGEIIGAIYVENRLIPAIFTRETGKILQFFGNQCAIAVENGKLFEEYDNLFKNLHEMVNARTNELKREKQYNEDLIQNLGEILFVVDENFNLIKANKAFNKVLGLEPQKYIGKNINTLYSKDTIDSIEKGINKKEQISNVKCSIENSKGELINFSATLTPLIDDKKVFSGTIIINSDMTEYEKLEEERAEKLQLEAITKATVTANDQINTPLGVIIGRTKIIETMYKDDLKLSKNLTIIKEQSFRIKDTLDKMKKMTTLKVKDYKLSDVTMLDLNE